MNDKLRVEANERIDLQDFEYLATDSIREGFEQITGQFFCDPVKLQKWVLDGFAMSNPAVKQLQVDKGRAILAQRRDGVVQYGIFSTEGEATRILDLNTYSPGTYGVYVRFEEILADNQSRVFWNPSGAGTEYAKTIPIRYQANWSLRVESASPGSEWLKLGEVDQATMTITDQRNFYFEGKFDDTYESGWSSDGGGSANDRNSDRATYGAKDLQTALAAIRQSLEDIKGRGLKRWWDRDIGGLNVGFDADPVEDRVAIGDADHYIELNSNDANWYFDTDAYLTFSRTTEQLRFYTSGTHYFTFEDSGLFPIQSSMDLGSLSLPWDILFVNRILAYENIRVWHTAPYFIFVEDGGASDEKTWRHFVDGETYSFQAGNDLESVWTDIFQVNRTGTVIDDFILKTDLTVTGSAIPRAWFTRTTGAANEKIWSFYAETDVFKFATHADTSPETTGHLVFFAERTGYVPHTFVFGDQLTLVKPGDDYVTDLGEAANPWKDTYSGQFRASDDTGGLAGHVTLTGTIPGVGGSTSRAVKGSDGSDNSGYLKFYLGTSVAYVPSWGSN